MFDIFKKPTLKKYGWLRDKPDHRDIVYQLPKKIKIPTKVDLRNLQSLVYDQGDLGSCSANSIAGCIDYIRIKNKKPPYYPSRLFIYYNERILENTVYSDSGATLRDGIKTVNKQGVCDEYCWPYDISKFTKKPPSKCYTQGLKEQVLQYQSLKTIDDLKVSLAQGYCFVFGFSVFESFESPEVAKTGIVPMPGPQEASLGGHAVLGVGYDDSTKMFIVKNSWGSEWGLKGYFYLPYSYISDPNLADDFWSIKIIE
jgi:C1A family cysteine protease